MSRGSLGWRRWGVAGALAALAGLAGLAHGAPFSVEWRAGLLSISADHANRADVLRDVARLTGSRITGLERIGGPVTLRLDAVDLASGLRALAGPESYALVELQGNVKAEPTRYEMHFAGPGTRQPDVMRPDRQRVAAWVEDLTTGEMKLQPPLPAAPAQSTPHSSRPPVQPKVSVQIEMEGETSK